MSKKEDKALNAWKWYYKSIKEYKLDEIQDRNHHATIDYMYDAFFSGFYEGYNTMREKENE